MPGDSLKSVSRRYPRMSAEFVVAYRREADGPGAEPHLAKTTTVGLGGLMFRDDARLSPGEMISLELVTGERTVRTAARVVYVEPSATGELHEIGLAFTSISDEDREYLLACFLQREYRIGED